MWLTLTAWKLLFTSLWKDFGSRFSGIIEDLKRQREFVDREAVSIDIVESKASRSHFQEEIKQRQMRSLMLIEQSETEAQLARKRHAVAWLSENVRDQEEHYERISSRRHDDTCKWVVRQSQMEVWMRSDRKAPLLWLNGKPGAGTAPKPSVLIEILTTYSYREKRHMLLRDWATSADTGYRYFVLFLQQPRRRQCLRTDFEDLCTSTVVCFFSNCPFHFDLQTSWSHRPKFMLI